MKTSTTFNIEIEVYLLVLVFAASMGILKIKRLDIASRVILLLLSVTIITELLAFYYARFFHHNVFIYHFSSPIYLFIVSLYYNFTIRFFRRKNLGLIIGILGLLVGILNTIFLQPPSVLNSYYLVFEGFCIISMALWSFIDIVQDDQWDSIKFCHFLFSFLLLFFWGNSYLIWALYFVVLIDRSDLMPYLSFYLWVLNMVTYLCFGLVYIRYPKKLKNE